MSRPLLAHCWQCLDTQSFAFWALNTVLGSVLDVKPWMRDDLAEYQQQGGHRSAQLNPTRAALPGSERLQPPLRRRIAANAILVPEQKQVERRQKPGNPQDREAHRVAVKSLCRTSCAGREQRRHSDQHSHTAERYCCDADRFLAAIASEAQPIQTPRNFSTPSLSGLELVFHYSPRKLSSSTERQQF